MVKGEHGKPAVGALAQISLRRRGAVSAAVAAAAVAVGLVGGSLATVDGYSIKDLQLAGSAARAAEVQGMVPDESTVAALRWDFVFIVGYTSVFLVCSLGLATGAFRRPWFGALSRPAAAAVGIAAGADVLENLAMLRGLRTGVDEPWRVAACAARVKFPTFYACAAYSTLAVLGYLAFPRQGGSRVL